MCTAFEETNIEATLTVMNTAEPVKIRSNIMIQQGSNKIQLNNQLPVGLLAQLVKRCTGIAEVMGSNPVRA